MRSLSEPQAGCSDECNILSKVKPGVPFPYASILLWYSQRVCDDEAYSEPAFELAAPNSQAGCSDE